VPVVPTDKNGVNVTVPLCTHNKYQTKIKSSSNKSQQMSAKNNQIHRKRVILGGIGPCSILIDRSIKLSTRLITQHIIDTFINWRKNSTHS